MTELERIFDEIVKHVRWTGDIILSADSPAASPRLIGWCNEAGTKSWNITLTRVKQDLNAMQDRAKAGLLGEYLVTSTGRVTIARSFPGQRTSGEPPTFECSKCNSRTWTPGYSADSHSEEECKERLTSAVMES